MVRIHLDVHIRTIVVLTGGNLTRFYFLQLLYAIYYYIMTHLRPGKKVSILPSGDVNPGPIPSRRGLLEDCMSIMRLVMIMHLGRGDLGMSCGRLLQDVNTFS
jgi:hypothetical protein